MTTLNFTNRIDLDRDEFSLELFRQHKKSPSFSFELLPEVASEFPGSSVIRVQAYLGSREESFEFGSIQNAEFGKRQIQSFTSDDDIRFRIMIVDTQQKRGLLLGFADNVRPNSNSQSGSESIIPVLIDKLDGEVYRIQFDGENGPLAVLNESLDNELNQGIKAVFRANPYFRALVLPSIMREVLTHIYIVFGEDYPSDEAPNWVIKWDAFAKNHNPEPLPEYDPRDPEPRRQWVNNAISNCASSFDAVKHIQNALTESAQ